VLLRRIGLSALVLLVLPSVSSANSATVYSDSLEAPWQDWSWVQHDMASTEEVFEGGYAISVDFGPWEGLYLHHGGLFTHGLDTLVFAAHGGASGGQAVSLTAYLASGVHGPARPLSSYGQLLPGTWTLFRIPMEDLGAADTLISGICWQEGGGATQPRLYLDSIRLSSTPPAGTPILSGGVWHRFSYVAGSSSPLLFRIHVQDVDSDVSAVTMDATPFGLQNDTPLFDDGAHWDKQPADGWYGCELVPASTPGVGELFLQVGAEDTAGHHSGYHTPVLSIFSPVSPPVPLSLPPVLGIGTSVRDWQTGSLTPWELAYQYITWGWETWGTHFVETWVQDTWQAGYVPVISVYMLIGPPPHPPDEAQAFFDNSNDPSFVAQYLLSLEEAAVQAQGDAPVVFHLEPDFLGYMQQLTLLDGDPSNDDDPSSLPAYVPDPSYPQTIAGLHTKMVDLIHQTADNALVGGMLSSWSTLEAIGSSTDHDLDVASAAARTATFVSGAGGSRCDLLFCEWADRDAGSGLSPWWDDTMNSWPNHGRALLWENQAAAQAQLPLVLWQVPCGNMALPDTTGAFRDNRVDFIFAHVADITDAGICQLLLGPGDYLTGTSPATDGGHIDSLASAYYAGRSWTGSLSLSVALRPDTLLLEWSFFPGADQYAVFSSDHAYGVLGSPQYTTRPQPFLRLTVPVPVAPSFYQVSADSPSIPNAATSDVVGAFPYASWSKQFELARTRRGVVE
jgi:hypothetical protein